MFEEGIVRVYSKIHSPVSLTKDNNISFDGSQIQKEFFTAWESINKYFKTHPTKKLTFLEVGAWKGLWGLAFCEFCKSQKIEGEYLTLTMIDQDPNNRPLYKTLEYINSQGIKASLIDMNTLHNDALPAVLKYGSTFDIVFIDADHSYEAVMSDISKFAGLADKVLLFHDIRPKTSTQACGVYQAITDSGIILQEEISVNENLMGIGIVYQTK